MEINPSSPHSQAAPTPLVARVSGTRAFARRPATSPPSSSSYLGYVGGGTLPGYLTVVAPEKKNRAKPRKNGDETNFLETAAFFRFIFFLVSGKVFFFLEGGKPGKGRERGSPKPVSNL